MKRTRTAVLVGCGAISRAWLNYAARRPDLRIVGLVDLRLDAARQRAEEYGLAGADVGTDLEAMLDAKRPDILLNCATPEAHLPTTLAALKRGCDVMVEKPLADSIANARKLVRAAASSGRALAVMQNRRFIRGTQALARFLRSGRIGRVTTVHTDFFLGAHFGGFRDRMSHVLLLDMSIHHFDMARCIIGADPVRVFCREWNPAGSWYEHEASAVCVFDMTGDVVYTYRGSWCSEGHATSWAGTWRIIGEKGSVLWDGENEPVCELAAGGKGLRRKVRRVRVAPEPARLLKHAGHAGAIHDFLESLRAGRLPASPAADNIKSLAMVFSAIRSAETGRVTPVTW